MATCAGIAVKTEKGYKTIYCHNDGYPNHMLRTLRDNYNSSELAAKLIELGNASFIGKKLEPEYAYHCFSCPEPDVSIFYHRDRGDDWDECEPELYTLKKDLFAVYYYAYIFDGEKWYGYKDGKKVTIYA